MDNSDLLALIRDLSKEIRVFAADISALTATVQAGGVDSARQDRSIEELRSDVQALRTEITENASKNKNRQIALSATVGAGTALLIMLPNNPALAEGIAKIIKIITGEGG